MFQILSARARFVCRIERKWIQIILWLQHGWPILILTGNHLNFESLTSSTSNRSNCWEGFWSWRSSGSKEQASKVKTWSKWNRNFEVHQIKPKAPASHSKEGSNLSNIEDRTTFWSALKANSTEPIEGLIYHLSLLEESSREYQLYITVAMWQTRLMKYNTNTQASLFVTYSVQYQNKNSHGGNPFWASKRQRGLLTKNKIAGSSGGRLL